jgi:CCR4-NOT transcription complex subunit 9
MAGLVSPKPVSYLQAQPQYNPYQRNILYSDTPPLTSHLSNQPANQQFVHVLGNSINVGATGHIDGHEERKLFQLVIELMDPNIRETALLELSKKREQYDDLAMILWHSFGQL